MTASIRQPPLSHLLETLAQELKLLEASGLRRSLMVLESVSGAEAVLNGRRIVSWCSNDYLGLSTHPQLTAAAAEAMSQAGVGARASRLLSGTTKWHQALEAELAAWFGVEAALLYPSGYQCNQGVLGALLSEGDVVFVDRLAHASLLDAARASRAQFRVFHHNDVDQLRQLLGKARARRRFIVTEGVFSMDGDRAPLADIVEAAEASGALVYLDDAHGAFVCGETGGGSPELSGVSCKRLVYMATLGKALGCQGGFVAGPEVLVDYLRNKSRPFIYSTALALALVAAARAAMVIVRQEPQRREWVQSRSQKLHAGLKRLNIPTAKEPAHILPAILGQTRKSIDVSSKLLQRGIWAPPIRPPTVPKDSARLRLGVTASHTQEHVAALVKALEEAQA